MPRPLTERGEEYRSWLPERLRDSPDHLAVIHAQSRELDRLEAAIEQVRVQFFPQTADILLGLWERVLGLTVEPSGVTIAERRGYVIARLRALASTPEGRDWVANVSSMVGPGWEYEEHVPGDVTSPPENTIRVTLPYPPTSSLYQQTERLIRDITPAHLDLIVTFSGGFVLDQSQLDQEQMI